MRIGVISNLYPPIDRGGAEQVALRVVRELYGRGHEVFVISTRSFNGVGSFWPQLTERHFEHVYRVFPFNLYHTLNDCKMPWFIRLIWHFIDAVQPFSGIITKRLIEQNEPDVILTHNLKGFGLRTVSAIRRSGVPHIHTLHDVQLSVPSGLILVGEESKWLNHSIFRKSYEWLTKQIFSSVGLIISPSNFLANFYKDRHFFTNSKIEILPNPAPYSSISVVEKRQPGPLRLLFAGQLEYHKGILFLIDALLKAKDLSFELHIAGDGALAKQVVKKASEDKRFIFHGFVSLDVLQKLFAISDGVIVPSLCYENSPTIIYESLQAGVPVIAADIGGVGELVNDGENGFLFTPGKQEALLDILNKLAKDVDIFRTRAKKIQDSVKDHTLSLYVDHLENIIDQLVKSDSEK